MYNHGPYSINNPKVYHCGDIMYDNSLSFSDIAEQKESILKRLRLENRDYVLATIHRANNTDEPNRLNSILDAIIALSNDIPVVLPLHPRTRVRAEYSVDKDKMERLTSTDNIKLIEPVSFLEMIQLEKHTRLVLTDSGGVQKEAYFFQKPCVITRHETEWVEIVATDAASLANADKPRILEACHHYLQQPPVDFPEIFGNGHAAEFILEKMEATFEK